MKLHIILAVKDQSEYTEAEYYAEAAPSKEIAAICTSSEAAAQELAALSEAETRKPEDERCDRFEIEEHDVDLGINIAVEVSGGLMQNVYASAHAASDIDVELYDLDVSDFQDDGEQEAADDREAQLHEIATSAEYAHIW